MTDHFALLNEPRRPWLDPDSLKAKFLALSATAHPDRVHQSSANDRAVAGDRFADLNAAYQTLREPKDRLRHLLELERGAKPADIQRVPEEMMSAMFEVGQLCKQADAFLAEYSRVTSPILKIPWFERAQDWVVNLTALQQKINSRREELLLELKPMNAAWENAQPLPLDRLEEIYRVLGYLSRWSQQIQERIVQLSL